MVTALIEPALLCAPEVEITGDAYRHLFRATRLAVGDALRVVDGRGHARLAEVARVDRSRGVLRLGEPAASLEPALELALVIAPPRPQRASWLVEKVTEIGASAVHFVATQRAPRAFGTAEIARLGRVAAAAVEQCGRARLPAVTGTHAWAELPDLFAGAAEIFALHPEAAGGRMGGPPGREREAAAGRKVVLLIGPEGGWTEGERAALAAWGCQPLSLGERILRIETAAVAGAALCLL